MTLPRIRRTSADELIGILHRVHVDNSTQQYFARQRGRRIRIMPLTPFVYGFFIFNSLYHIDWPATFEGQGIVENHWRDIRERDQQRRFLRFVWERTEKHPEYLYRALEPLTFLPTLDGSWIEVNADSRITAECRRLCRPA